MGYVRQISLPASEPVSKELAKLFCRTNSVTDEDDLFTILIAAAREYAEAFTGRALAKRQFVQVLDSHPYYTDTIQGQLAFPPSYYSLPLYSTTLWNYSQMIKLRFAPVWSVDEMKYIKPDGTAAVLVQDVDFVLDRITEPARIFPPPGGNWPADLYVPNAVQIKFTAGYDPNAAASPDSHDVSADPPNQQPNSTVELAVPQTVRVAILQLVAHWYAHREAVIEDNKLTEVPIQLQELLWANAIVDFAPTRG